MATLTDRSGSITTGGTAQQLFAIDRSRRGYRVQNTSAGDLYINDAGAASTTTGIKIPAGALYEAPVHGPVTVAVSIFGASGGQTFIAAEY